MSGIIPRDPSPAVTSPHSSLSEQKPMIKKEKPVIKAEKRSHTTITIDDDDDDEEDDGEFAIVRSGPKRRKIEPEAIDLSGDE